jgi:putative sigma-54 modulation protein
MQFNIRGVNVEMTQAIAEYIEKKIGRIERYFDSPLTSEVHVTCSVLKDKQSGEKHNVEVTIPLNNVLLRAEEKTDDMYASIDRVEEKLERQIRKHKTKINRKFRQNGGIKSFFNEAILTEPVGMHQQEEDEVVKTKKFNFKPMDVEEAILQMDLLGHSFFVFSNAVSNETNVIYKRNDGRYGLIVPE